MKFLNKLAFTLAEVLMVLGIIGVVASMTLPSLVKNMENQKRISNIKKVYSMLTQAAYSANSDNGILPVGFSSSDLYDHFVPYLRPIKECKTNSGDCDASVKWCMHMNDTGCSTYMSNEPSIQLGDGTVVWFRSEGISGTYSWATISWDYNGDKPPNRLGYDIFMVQYRSEGTTYKTGLIHACDWSTTSKGCNSPTKNGYCCVGEIMRNGWSTASYIQ